MSGLEVRVNDDIVLVAPFDEADGEQGVIGVMIEWMNWGQREICWLAGLSLRFRQLYPGDQVTITVVSGPVKQFGKPEWGADVSRARPSKPRELALDITVNGQDVQHVQSPKAVDASVCWVEPTPEMTARGVEPSLRLTWGTGPDDIRSISLKPNFTVRVVLNEAPVASAEAAYGTGDEAAGAA